MLSAEMRWRATLYGTPQLGRGLAKEMSIFSPYSLENGYPMTLLNLWWIGSFCIPILTTWLLCSILDPWERVVVIGR